MKTKPTPVGKKTTTKNNNNRRRGNGLTRKLFKKFDTLSNKGLVRMIYLFIKSQTKA